MRTLLDPSVAVAYISRIVYRHYGTTIDLILLSTGTTNLQVSDLYYRSDHIYLLASTLALGWSAHLRLPVIPEVLRMRLKVKVLSFWILCTCMVYICTAVIRFFHESMHGNYPDACKIIMHVKSLLQTRIMHGIRLNQGYFVDFRRPVLFLINERTTVSS